MPKTTVERTLVEKMPESLLPFTDYDIVREDREVIIILNQKSCHIFYVKDSFGHEVATIKPLKTNEELIPNFELLVTYENTIPTKLRFEPFPTSP